MRMTRLSRRAVFKGLDEFERFNAIIRTRRGYTGNSYTINWAGLEERFDAEQAVWQANGTSAQVCTTTSAQLFPTPGYKRAPGVVHDRAPKQLERNNQKEQSKARWRVLDKNFIEGRWSA